MADLGPAQEQQLHDRAAAIRDQPRSQVARAINTAMVRAYWLVGREIVEVEQRGDARAGYGVQLLEGLAARLTARFGKAFGVATLRRMRAFYVAYPKGSAFPGGADGRRIRSTPLIESERERRSAPLTESELRHCAFPPILSWSHCLPTEDELRAELTRERDEAERVLAANADDSSEDP
jgi:hypothetical protein